MPRNIFDDDETLLDYGHMNDELGLLGMGDRGYVDLDPPEGSDELFIDQFERRAAEIQRTPAGLQSVQIIRQKNGAWSGNNNLGIEVEFAPSSNKTQTILKLDEWGFPEVWTAMLGVRYSDDSWGTAGAAPTFFINAHVLAGAGGAVQELDVDWIQGTTFSLPMNALNVIAEYRFNQDTPRDLRLSVTLCRGKVAGRPPTKSNFLIPSIAAGNTSARFRIPPFARSVMLLDRTAPSAAANSVYSANCTLTLHAAPTGLQTISSVIGSDLIQFGSNGYPLSEGAHYFSISSAAPAAGVSPTVIFFLGL